MTGRLAGIARHGRSRGPVQVLDEAAVSMTGGIAGDFRGAIKPGGRGKRQVTIMTRAAWNAATAELATDLHWSLRRVNLLVEDIELPRCSGWRLHVGEVVFDVTGECDPCERMEEVAPGLRAALTPDWRGGWLARVAAAGKISVGDAVHIEE